MLYVKLFFIFLFSLYFIDINGAINPRIIGGISAYPGEFPYIVSLSYNWAHICGGSIITEKHVVTAAHCFYWNDTVLPLGKLRVTAGSNDLFWGFYLSETRHVQKVFIPEVYEGYENDLAVLEVDNPFIINSTFISAIDMQSMEVPENTICTVAGWGVQNFNVTMISNNLRAVNVSIGGSEECNYAYKEYNFSLTSATICAGDELGDSCQGDSGGPLVCDGKLTGIVSSGAGCAHKDYPGLYTNVSSHLDWILSIVKNKLPQWTVEVDLSNESRFGANDQFNQTWSTSSKIAFSVKISCLLLFTVAIV